jgi:hypothetical protein
MPAVRVDAKPFLERQLPESGPLLFWKDGPAETRDGMVWFVTTCTNPLCSCRDAIVHIFTTDDRLICVDELDDGLRQHNKPVDGRAPCADKTARIFLDVDSGHVDTDAKDKPDAGLVAWARAQIDAAVLDNLRRRFAAGKERGSSELVLDFKPEQWTPGELLPYSLVHTGEEIEIEHNGRLFFVDDLHCVEPGCPCENVLLTVYAIDDDAAESTVVGAIRLPLDGKKSIEISPEPRGDRELLLKLLDELRRGESYKALPERRLRMRALAPEIHRRAKPKPARAATKIGRNDPCPCGSGRKYKKCCLNKAA